MNEYNFIPLSSGTYSEKHLKVLFTMYVIKKNTLPTIAQVNMNEDFHTQIGKYNFHKLEVT